MYMQTYTRIYVHYTDICFTNTRIYSNIRAYACKYTYVRTYTYIYINIYTNAYIYMHVRAYACICTNLYIYTLNNKVILSFHNFIGCEYLPHYHKI